MWRGGGEGRVPSLMAAAVEREVSNSYFFSFFFYVSLSFQFLFIFFLLCCVVHGAFDLNGNVMRFASTPKEYHLG
jgi:hypothetical protein